MRVNWNLHPASIAVAITAGFVIGMIEAVQDERKRRHRRERNGEAEMWYQAGVSDTMESPGSSNESTNPADRPAADSGVPVSKMPPVAFYEQKPDQKESS